ncbi:MAG: MFS transporter [Dysgonamonadaceae bacterium]|jgi:fucose permease|nr:MFS transporter [Dysgonamonadaceae bacterium]
MNYKKIAFATVFAAIFLFGVSMVIIGSILPELKTKFGLDEVAAGELFLILPLGLLVGSITFGPISDRHGYRWVLATALLFLGIGFLGIAHATNHALLKLCILLFGIGGGIINGASSALISDLSSENEKIANLNLLGVFFGVGAFLTPFLMSFINPLHHTTLLNMVAILCFVTAVLFIVVRYPEIAKKEKISIKLVPKFLKNKLFMVICFFLFFQSAFEAIVNNWGVSFFIGSKGAGQDSALQALSASVLGMTLLRILTGGVLRHLRYSQLMGIALASLTSGLVLLVVSSSFYINTAGMFFIGAGLSAGFPVMLGIVGGIYKGVSGTAFSFALFVALVGNMIINYSTGVLAKQYGIGIFPWIVGTEIVCMALLFVYILRNKS